MYSEKSIDGYHHQHLKKEGKPEQKRTGRFLNTREAELVGELKSRDKGCEAAATVGCRGAVLPNAKRDCPGRS